jgi:3-oxoacyl-[acyl-carrier protein] reductase
MEGRFAGRVALVTGASRGIGRACALALGAEGAVVAVNYRSQADKAEAVVAEIEAAGGRARAFGADVGDPAAAADLVGRVIAELGGLHILVNNAGIARDGLLFNLEPDAWVEVMRVNFGGVFHCTKAVIDHFAAQGGGVIVNVSSTHAERGWAGVSNYAASKGAVNAFTRAAAVELARFGIRVNAVMAGITDTEMVESLTARDGGRGVIKQVPLRRTGQPEEVAAMVTMLAGLDSGYVTGVTIPVDGGALATLGIGQPL